MNNLPKILKAMFAVFFVLQIIFYSNLYANKVDVTKLDRYMDKLETNRENIFSLSVTEKGSSIYLRSIGLIDPDFRIHSDINTPYRIGELSKTFTSVLILQMVDERMIQLGTPVSRFFPEIPNGKHISIQDLLLHRVNIINYLPGGKFYLPIKSEFVFEELLKDQPLVPTEFEFSDPNYLLLGMIIERVTGMDYNEILKERITNRLGLLNTSSMNTGSDQSIGKWDLHSLKGSGSIISTPGDLGKFMHALYHEHLISDKSLKILLSMNEKLNVFTTFSRCGFGYTGTIDGFSSQMIYFPSDSICISFSMNANANNTMEELVKIIYGS